MIISSFFSFAHLALLIPQGVNAVVRVQQQMIDDLTPGRPHIDPRQSAGSKQIAGRAVMFEAARRQGCAPQEKQLLR